MCKKQIPYRQEDFIKIIHITDMDGGYIREEDIKEAEAKAVVYYENHYDGKAEEVVKFISDPVLAVPGAYQNTWDYIEKERNSLERHSNMHLIFE